MRLKNKTVSKPGKHGCKPKNVYKHNKQGIYSVR